MATILIVDDLSANRRTLSALLEDRGHRLLEAVNGRQALACVAAERPDLIITDVLMPVMDGYEFVRQLRLAPGHENTPVLFYTAPYGAREAHAAARQSGAWALSRTAPPDRVIGIIDDLLAGTAKPPDAVSEVEGEREQLRLLTDTLSDQADDLRLTNIRLRALVNIGLELSSQGNPDRLLQSVCDSACDLFGATYATLAIVAPERCTVRAFVTCGTDAESWLRPGNPIGGILERVVRERRTLRADNPDGEASRIQLPVGHPEARAVLAVPVCSASLAYGWICLVNNEGRSFTQVDEDLALALAAQVGRLFELEHEVAERKEADAALRRERDRSQQYLDTAAVILLALDADGRVTLINRYGCSVLGWSADELMGRDFIATCVPEHLRDETRARLSGVLSGPDMSIVENPISTRAGRELLFEWRNTVLRDASGAAIGTLSSGADVTERHEAVESLRATEERMRFALEAAGVGIWDMNFRTGVLTWSDILAAQYGLAPGAFEGTFAAFIARVHPLDRAALAESMGEANRSGADFQVEHRSQWPDGTIRWLNGAGRINLDEAGQPLRGLGISLDVSARHQLEGQYLQAQKMEAIGQLAGGVAHDFNNLLTAILGYCGILMSASDVPEARLADVGEIQKAGESAARLTRQLLAFSRKQIIEPTVFDLNEVVIEMRPMLGRLIREDVSVVLTLRPESTPIRADRGQVEQIIMNLAVNARDAMPSGGTLTIATAAIRLDEHYAASHPGVKPGAYVALTVSDTGTGMSPEVQARLFEPFFTTKGLGQGTGLGLATVHGIVGRSGGSVAVYSEPGRGTAFKVYLPRAAMSAAVEAAAAPAYASRAAHETILVVEDSELLRGLIRRLLERQGYTVIIAASPAEAVVLFEANLSIDMLLTDVVMPGGSGPELSSRLLERRPGLKVLYMSGYTEDAITNQGVLMPGIAFLNKPFTSEGLLRKVGEILEASS